MDNPIGHPERPRALATDDIDYPLARARPGYVVKRATRRAADRQASFPAQPRLLGLNTVSVTRPLAYPSHRHADHEVVFVEIGPYRCAIDGRPLVVEAGQALLLRPGNTHELSLLPGQRHRVLNFRLAGLAPQTRSSLTALEANADPRDQIFAYGDGFADLLGQIERESESPRPFSPQIQDSLLQTLFWRMLSAMPPSLLSPRLRQHTDDQFFLDLLLERIESSLHLRLGVADLAEQLGVSKSTLVKRCRRLLGEPPSKAFMRAKTSRAADLLAEPGRSVKEVSYLLGFQNPYHFSRVFKAYQGYPPSQTRASGPKAP